MGTQRPRPRNEVRPLPRPEDRDSLSMAEALSLRRSHREFADKALALEHVSRLCWAAQGITDSLQGFRTAPSAGALFPITLLVVSSEGVHQYQPKGHSLCHLTGADVRAKLQRASLDQACVATAPVCLAIAADVARSAGKYGRRAERYCLLEAGHVAQNVLLEATALGLVGVPVGAFKDREIAAVLDLPRA